MIWKNILIGTALIIITILAHSVTTRYILHLAKRKRNPDIKHLQRSNEFWVALFVVIIFSVTLAESSLWAVTYIFLGAFQTFESALYFSIVTFTTLGYGDITLDENWRLLSSIEAAIGIIIFGWSTALIIAVVQKLYFKN
jgi:Flp pilus assembly protein protease CpaA